MKVYIVQRESCDYDDFDQEVKGVFDAEWKAFDWCNREGERLVNDPDRIIDRKATWVGKTLTVRGGDVIWGSFTVHEYEVQS